MTRRVARRAVLFSAAIAASAAWGRAATLPERSENTGLPPDPSLERRVSLRKKSAPVGDVLEALSGPGLRIRAERDLASRRVTCFGEQVRLGSLLEVIAYSLRLSWREAAGGYVLYQTRTQREWERSRRSASQARWERADRLQRQALTQALAQAARRPGESGLIGEVLARLTPSQLQAAGEVASMPEGIMVASSMAHTHDRLLGVTRLSAFPEAVRARLESAVRALPAGLKRPPRAPGSDELGENYIGVVVLNRGVDLAVVDPAGKEVWLYPGKPVARRGIPGVDGPSNNDLERIEAVTNATPGALVALGSLKEPGRGKPLEFSDIRSRTRLPELLDRLAERTGVPFVSDDLLRSRATPYRWVLTDQDRYSLREALLQIARAFGHRFEVKSGVICARTLTPGLDLRAEVSAAVLDRLKELERTRHRPEWGDYLRMGALTDLQWDTLFRCAGDLAPVGSLPARDAFAARHWLRPYLALSNKQRSAVASPDGLELGSVGGPSRTGFWKLLNVGLEARRERMGETAPARLTLERAPGGAKGLTRLTLTLRGTPGAAVKRSFDVATSSSRTTSK